MIVKALKTKVALCGIILSFAGTASAQAADWNTEIRNFTDEEITAIPMPDVEFDDRRTRSADFDKYFYFHRQNTTFIQAFADITECDKLSNGRAFYSSEYDPFLGYLGGAVADAIHGSAERRAIRRINMRNCMGFKGYQRYGLVKKLWKTFNFEEGGGREEEDVRQAALLKQARLASGPKPKAKVLAR